MEIDGHFGPCGKDGGLQDSVVLAGTKKQWLASDVVESYSHRARLVKEYWTKHDAGDAQRPAAQEAVPDGFRPKKRKEHKAQEQNAKGGGSYGEKKRAFVSPFFTNTDHRPAVASTRPAAAPAQPKMQAAAPSRGARMVGDVLTNAVEEVAAARNKQQKRRRVIEDSDEG